MCSLATVLRGFKERVTPEEYEQLGLGSAYLSSWTAKHKGDSPAHYRLWCELRALELHRYYGDYKAACNYMKRKGFSGIYWRDNMW